MIQRCGLFLFCNMLIVCFCSRVDYERIKAVGPDRAAAEWLLRCGAKVRFRGFDRWQHDYNGLPTGPLGRYQIQAIDATESCIMYRGFDYLGEWRLHTITDKIPCMILILYPLCIVLLIFVLLFSSFTILHIHPRKSQKTVITHEMKDAGFIFLTWQYSGHTQFTAAQKTCS